MSEIPKIGDKYYSLTQCADRSIQLIEKVVDDLRVWVGNKGEIEHCIRDGNIEISHWHRTPAEAIKELHEYHLDQLNKIEVLLNAHGEK